MATKEELVRKLRQASGWRNASEHYALMREAADTIDALLYKMCSMCGVCQENRRNPYDCEILGTDSVEGGGEDG